MSTLTSALRRRASALVFLLVIAPLVVPATAPLLPLPLRIAADQAFAPQMARAQGGGSYTVNTTRDDFDAGGCEAFGGPGAPTPLQPDCTLREAITAANEDNGPSTIGFNLRIDDPGLVDPDPLVGGNEFWRIRINGAFGSLPTITDSRTTIDGTTQTNSNNFGPDIEIDGESVPAAEAIGLDVTSSNNVIKGLIINDFEGDNQVFLGFGIRITGTSATSNTVVGNYIGVNYNSTEPISNTFAGIQLSGGASGNTIGGSSSADLNIISGNGANGILLDNADNNTIVGNRIGIDNAGQRRQNFGNGVALINGSANNQIGGVGNLRNTISGNTANGVVINNVNTIGNRIQGNYIGTNLNGTSPIGNDAAGIQIGLGARNNIIGGAETAQGTLGNVISGNGGAGIRLSGGLGSTNTVFGNRILGNLIGLDGAGSARIANNGSGVELINNSQGTQIGSNVAAERNFIAGNLRYGVEISSSLPLAITGTVLVNNDIGLNAARTGAISNTLGGVLIGATVDGIQIGDGTISGTNTIAGNGGPGVIAVGVVRNLNVVSNTIGLPTLGNATGGIVASGVITLANVSDNSIVDNGGAGLLLSNVLSGTIARNRVGTLFNSDPNVNSFVDLGNGGSGIQATSLVTGLQVLSNTVAFNGAGIALTGATTPTLQANVVFSNTLSGIELNGSRATSLISNEVTLNAGGIVLTNAVSPTLRANRVLSNTLVGVQLSGARFAQVLSNTLSFNVAPGLLVDAGTIGSRVLSNTIEGNGGGGVRVDGASTVTNTIQGNVFRFNVDPFVNSSVRGVGGVSLSNGANQNIQPPAISYVDRFNNVVGNVNGPGGCNGVTCTVELYDAYFGPATNEENSEVVLDDDAFTLLRRITVGPSGLFTVTLSSTPRRLLSATTNISGSSSAFGEYQIIYGLDLQPTLNITTALPTDILTFTHRLTNTGTVSDSITLRGTSSLGWSQVISPNSVSLAPGQSTPVVVVLTVPPGGRPNSFAGLTDISIITATQSLTTTSQVSATERTTLGAAARLTLSPGQTQDARAGDTARFRPTLNNAGNVTTTAVITASTDQAGWNTGVNPLVVTLGPGESRQLAVDVAVPLGAIPPITATTNITVTTIDAPVQVLSNTNTVRLVTTLAVTINPDQAEQFGAAGGEVVFRHSLFYGGNGPGSVLVRVRSNFPNYPVSVESATTGRSLGPNGRVDFSGPGDSIEILVRVRVPNNAFVGDQQITTIEVARADDPNSVIDTAQDTVVVIRGQRRPTTLYFPVFINQRVR